LAAAAVAEAAVEAEVEAVAAAAAEVEAGQALQDTVELLDTDRQDTEALQDTVHPDTEHQDTVHRDTGCLAEDQDTATQRLACLVRPQACQLASNEHTKPTVRCGRGRMCSSLWTHAVVECWREFSPQSPAPDRHQAPDSRTRAAALHSCRATAAGLP